jgi:uncharacterized membrane protein
MESRVKVLGHPAHQILIVFPLGLLVTSVVFDGIAAGTGSRAFGEVAFWMIASGIVGGLLAAPFGLIDWLAIPRGTRADAVGMWHGLGNVLVLALFAASLAVRYNGDRAAPSVVAYVLAVAGLITGMVTAWLGGELVDRLGIGVDPGANVNAPSSLSGRPAGPTAPQPY